MSSTARQPLPPLLEGWVGHLRPLGAGDLAAGCDSEQDGVSSPQVRESTGLGVRGWSPSGLILVALETSPLPGPPWPPVKRTKQHQTLACERLQGHGRLCRYSHRFQKGFATSLRMQTQGGHSTPQDSCLESPMDRGVWQATVDRGAKSWTRLKRLSMHAGMQIQV